MTAPIVAARDDAVAQAPPRPGGGWAAPRRVRVAALLLVGIQLLVRSWLVSGRDYFSDDFTLLHLADRLPLLSPSFLLHDHDGQLMPGALLLVGVVERVAPLQWWPAAVSLIGMQALASLALLRVLRVLLGDRPVLLVPLAFGLFTPLTLGSSTWWAAALNSLPLQIGLAWFLAEAVLLARTGQRRHARSGVAVLALTCTFYLKAVLVPWLGFAVVAIVLFRDGERAPLAAAWRRDRPLWTGSLLVTGCWAVTYVSTRTGGPVSAGSGAEVLRTVRTGLRALAPAVLGGPFGWALSPPAAPVASVPTWVDLAGALAVLAAVVCSVLRLRGAVVVWALVLVHAVVGLVIAAVGRSSLGLGDVLPLAYRYFAADSVVLAVAGALLVVLPRRGRAGATRQVPARWVALTTIGLTAVFVLASLASTVDYGRAWEGDRTGAYLATARESLAAAGPAPLLDQSLPADVMWTLTASANRFSRALSPLPDRPGFGPWTSDLRVLDDRGRLVPAHVAPAVAVVPAPDGCGHAVGTGGTAVPLQAALFDWGWTVELDYVADRDGSVTVALGNSAPLAAPVSAGSHRLFVQLTGGAGAVEVTSRTPDLQLCVRSGVVGTVEVG